MLDALRHDLRHAARWLARSPGFTLVAVLSLSLGIGVNTAIFAVVDALLLRPLPVHDPARLVDLYTSGGDGDTYSTSSLPDLLDIRNRTGVFDDVMGYSPMFAAVTGRDRTRLVLGEVVTGNYFRLLGVRARLGRTILPEDDRASAPAVAVLSYGYWQKAFAGDPGVLGRELLVRGRPFTVVGVLGPGFTGMVPMLAPEIWTPVQHADDVEPAGINESVPSPTGTSRLDRRGQRWLFAKARLRPGASIEQARASVDVVAAQLRAAHVLTNRDRRLTVRRTSETRLHPEADALLAWLVTGTMAAVGLVLAIACANVAGMLLARASARQREISIRLALGAGRGRLVRQLLTESLLLGLLGAGAGVALAWWLTRWLTTFDLPIPIALSLDLRLDARVMAFTLVIAVGTGVLAGLAPALRATRASLVTDLKGEVAMQRVAGRRWSARDLLVVGQLAVTVVLLVVAGLLMRSLIAAQAADVGFRKEGLAVVSADTDMLRYSAERSTQFWSEAERRLRALPGVQGVAFASRAPFSMNFNRTTIAVPGHQKSADESGAPINSASVSAEYFATLGVALLQGRAFENADTPARPRVAIVNETMAKRYWPNEPAVGRQVFERRLDSGRSFEIVGVVADHKQRTVGEPPQPAIYFATSQRPGGYHVVLARTSGPESALLAEMRKTLAELEPNVLLLESQTMNGQVSAMLLPVRIGALLVAVFAGLGLVLATVGLYGVIAFSVAQRTREIGIRMAIGAQPGALVGLVMRQGLALACTGLAVGVVLGVAATRVVAGALYGIGTADPVAWGLAAAVLIGVAALANLIPARRAMRVDPVRALRMD